jgi:MFS family permease
LALSGFLDRNRTIARSGYNRWFVPPAALSIHLCIGQIYAYSVFNKPMTLLVGITESVASDWTLTQLGWIFSIALFVLGASAALFGKWVERVGPRKAMFVSALCFSGGFLVASIGIRLHNIWLVYFGHGLLGGIGLGLGYISPVSTLIKWFPDRPGLATGMAIMGFGGGAMIASPLSVKLMNLFSNASSIGVGDTFLAMGLIYFLVMMIGVWIVRIPPEGWMQRETVIADSKTDSVNLTVDEAVRTPQFWLVFLVLMLNVTAGIGVLGQASVMIQEMFGELRVGEAAITVAGAAAFVGLLSLFNMLGRFFWSTTSDFIGRRSTYNIFFILGAVLYISIPTLGRLQHAGWFMATFCLIISMYGGGFATIPAYLRDLFGTKQVGAIHGRLLMAWSLAAVFGPSLINYLREYQIETVGLPASEAYSFTMYIMASLLIVGLVCNLLIRPVGKKSIAA